MDKEDVIHTYNGILLSHKKNEIIPFVATWMNLEIIIPSKVSQRKANILSLTCRILKNGTNELIYCSPFFSLSLIFWNPRKSP